MFLQVAHNIKVVTMNEGGEIAMSKEGNQRMTRICTNNDENNIRLHSCNSLTLLLRLRAFARDNCRVLFVVKKPRKRSHSFR